MQSNILILDASQRSALAIVRSLGQLTNANLICADVHIDSLAGSSQYCTKVESYADPSQSAAFIRDINRIIEQHKIEVIYPTTEITLYTLLENSAQLKPVTLPFSDLQTVKRLSDKGKLVSLCQDLSLPVPKSDYYADAQALQAEHKTYQYPVVLKPTLSRVKHGETWVNTAVTYAHSSQELEHLVTRRREFREFPFMVQEYIDGYGSGVFLLYSEGEYVAHFAHRRLREKPPQGGVSVLSESVEADPAQLATARALLDAVGWHGVAMVEFKVAADGTAYVIEVNPRFWGSLQLSIDAGVDFPMMLHQASMGQTVEKISQYKVGQRLRWLLGDLDRLYLILKSSDYSLAQKCLEFARFVLPVARNMRYEVNRLSDMKPFRTELKQYLKALR